MRLLVLVLVGLSGCTAPDGPVEACADREPTLPIDEVREDSLLVDDRSLVIYAHDAQIFAWPECTPIHLADVEAGQHAAHDADHIAISYPAQARPTVITVR